jgi:glycosyltransferase involved in cell wall biosynthesis
VSAVTTSGNPRSDPLAYLRPRGDITDACCAPVCSAPALTVVLPCYNEAERLPSTLRALLAHLSAVPGEVEVLVVDDGSTDATVEVAEAVAAVDRRVRVLSHRPNRGKGFAVRTGMLAAQGELVVFTDADGSYGPSDLDRILAALAQAPVAIGTRTGGTSGAVARRAASRVFNMAIRGALGLSFTDTQSGLKGFRWAAAQQIFGRARVDGFAFDVEVLWLARQLRLEVAEVHVQALERPGSKVQMVADALEMLGEVWAVRQAATHRGLGEAGTAPTRSPQVAASATDPQLGTVATPAGAPAALSAS